MSLPEDAGTAANVEMKFNATVTHLARAAVEHPDQLFISFSSAEHNTASPPVVPKAGLLSIQCVCKGILRIYVQIMALGDGNVPGVNQKLLPWLRERKGKRFGVISAYISLAIELFCVWANSFAGN